MNPLSVAALARGFRVVGALLGAPSIVVLVLYGVHTLRQRLAAPPVETSFGDHPDAVLALLRGLTQAAGAVAHVVGSLAQLVLDAAALAAGAGLLVAAACWVTGRGLHADALWARVSASVLLGLGLLVALLLALSLRGAGRVLPLALVALGAFALHALWLAPREPAG